MLPADLRALRKRLALTQAQFAAGIGISRSRLHDYETGATRDKDKTPVTVPLLVERAARDLERELTA